MCDVWCVTFLCALFYVYLWCVMCSFRRVKPLHQHPTHIHPNIQTPKQSCHYSALKICGLYFDLWIDLLNQSINQRKVILEVWPQVKPQPYFVSPHNRPNFHKPRMVCPTYNTFKKFAALIDHLEIPLNVSSSSAQVKARLREIKDLGSGKECWAKKEEVTGVGREVWTNVRAEK